MSSNFRFDGKEYTKLYPKDERLACRNECLCAATGVLFFVPLISAPDSQYGKFWANQGLITLCVEGLCLIAGFLLKLIFWLLGKIPFLTWISNFLFTVCVIALWAIVIFYIICGIYFAVKCRAKNLPFLGHIRFLK